MTFQIRATGILVLAVITLLLFPVQAAKADVSSEQSYKIQDGETLWSVADKFYGDGFNWTYLASRNNIQDATNIPAGKILFIPPLTSKFAKTENNTLVFDVPKPQTEEVKGASTVSLEDAVYADLAIKHYLSNVSVYSFDGKAENTISINADKQWLPASTVKTFVAMYAFDQIDRGNLNLDDQVLVQAKNVVPTELVTDELPALAEGEYVTIDRLIRQMVTQSDNTAYNVLLDVLDRRSITDYIHSIGLTHSAVGSKLNLDDAQFQYEETTPGYGINTTTASDYSLAFRLINDGKIAGSSDLLTIFSQQKINNMIPFLLPKSVRVAHKTGDLDPLYHDGGIVISPNRKYVLSIFTNVGDPGLLAHISNLVYTKNLNLIGTTEKASPISENPDQSLDPLVAQGGSTQVLGSSTGPIPGITAADLGITASDLSTSIKSQNLPKVLIPADSRFHFLVTAFQTVKRVASIDPSFRNKTNLETIKLKIAESNDLKSRGKVNQANQLLASAQESIVAVAKDKGVSNDPVVQTAIQSVSDTRFSILGDELKNSNNTDRIKLIKEIAKDAKQTVKEVSPLIPQAGNALNPAQRPLVGEVVTVSDTSIKVKTAGGQEIEIPNGEVKTKDATKVAPQPSNTLIPLGPSSASIAATVEPPSTMSLSSIKSGTTIALIGSSKNGTFTPTFVLKNISKELIAPQPVVVLKVDTKKKILVVSENGVPVQVNLTSKAVIKGQDTNVSLSSIKQGDIVVVHPEPSKTTPAPAQVPGSTATSNPTSSTTPAVPGTSPSPSSSSGPVILRSSPSGGQPTINNNQTIPSAAPNSNQNVSPQGPSQNIQKPGGAPVNNSKPSSKTYQPVVIQSSSVQVIQKNISVPPPPSKPSGGSKRPNTRKSGR